MKRILILITLIFSIFVQVYAQSSSSLLECGSVVDGELTPESKAIDYPIILSPGTTISMSAVPIGDVLRPELVLFAPSGDIILTNYQNPAGESISSSMTVSSSGNYRVRVQGVNQASFGAYTLFIGCTLSDGRIIEPGTSLHDISPEPTPEFSGFGFPGLASVDFSEGIEIPLTAGTAAIGAIASDLVTLYTYDALADTTATLSISRASGDISIGVAVIHKDTNQIIFMGGMPFSDKLSVELSFPVDGTYVIGLFQLVTKEASETSGAVEIVIE